MKKHPLSSLDADIEAHIAAETQENIARGMAPRDARHAALRRFGNVARTREETRAVWTPVWIDQVRQDVRYALRTIRHSPGLTLVAMLTLAVGIGLTTAVFSVVNAVLLRPLPYADGERIVLVRETFRNQPGNASPGHFHDWTGQNTVFEHTAAGQAATFNLADAGDPERVRGMRVTAGYFLVARMPPAIGRYFTPEDVAADERLVVLSHSLWDARFGGDPAVVGRQIRLGGEPFTVVGVAPPAFALTDPPRAGVTGGFSSQLWTPLTFPPDQRASFGAHYLGVLAKLKPDVTLARAQEDLERVTGGIAVRHPEQMDSRGVILLPLQEELVGGVRAQLVVLLAAVALVLVIGCVNIASLLMARAASRRREIAIRASLGGGQSRIVRQLLTESVVLALAGGFAALLVAQGTLAFLVSSGPETLPRLREAGLDGEALLFALAVTAAAAVLFGLAPALRAARTDLQTSLRDGGKGSVTGAGSRDRLRTAMVVGEIAITVVLLAGTGLLVRSAERLKLVPLGFNPHAVLTARLALPASRYQDDASVSGVYRRVLEGVRGASGVSHAAAVSHLPIVSPSSDASTVPEGKTLPLGSAPSPAIRLVTDEYFEAMGMPLASGRSLQPTDMVPGSPRVVVINERLADALWPGERPVGKRLSTWAGPDDPEWREVVGVVRDARSFGQNSPAPMELFIPYTQPPFGAWTAFQRSMALVVRTSEDWPITYVPLLRRATADVDPSVPLYEVRTMEEIVVRATASRRFYLRLVLLLAGTGLGLAVLGIYGVIAYFVTLRSPEIGLRLALGARRGAVVRMVVEQGLRTTAIGIAVGVPAALALTRLMGDLLYEIVPSDPVTFAAVVTVLVLTTAAAALVPSAKAARVDPLVALRHE